MGGPESKERVEIIISLPDEITTTVRSNVLRALGELFQPKLAIITCARGQIQKVIDMLAQKHPNLEIRERMTGGFTIQQKKQEVHPVIPVIEASQGNKGEEEDGESGEAGDDALDPIKHHVDGSWDKLSRDTSEARSFVYEINRPNQKRKAPKWKVSFNGYSFYYRGESMPMGQLTPFTLKGLKKWVAEINRIKKEATKRGLFS